jgi:hypothetical protein
MSLPVFGVMVGLEVTWVLMFVWPYVWRTDWLCSCSTFYLPHLITRGLLLHGLLGCLLALVGLAAFGFVTGWFWILVLLHGVWTLWRWWKHSRNGRKKLLKRLAGRVRDLGGRLVVEPVSVT